MTYYDIEPREFAIISSRSVQGGIQYELSTVTLDTEYPMCGSRKIKRNGTRKRQVRDLPEHGQNVGLLIVAQKYQCLECGYAWNHHFDTIDDNGKMTKRMRDYIATQALKKPFRPIAEELSLSLNTVKNAFLDYTDTLALKYELHAPTVLGIDENHLGGNYRAVFTDVENRLILDILPKRNKKVVQQWLQFLPDKQRVKCVTMDMWIPYREAVHEVLPNVPIVIDKFHVIKELNSALEQIRRRLRASMSKDERRGLRREKYLLLRNAEDLSFDQQERLHDLFQKYPVFETPYFLKEDFRDIYLRSKDRQEAERRFFEWSVKANDYTEFAGIATTVCNWFDEIFNYFDHPYTNAVTESLNNVINEISQRGKGYSFEVLRAKALYGTRATKQARFRFETEVPTVPILYEQMGLTRPISTTRRVIIHGAGVDIDELQSVLESGEF